MNKEIKINKSYILPRDWWGAKYWLGMIIPLLYGLYRLFFDFVIPELSAGQKYTFQDIWSISIATIFGLGVSVFVFFLIYNSLKKTTIQLTPEGIITNNNIKKIIKWDDIINYTKNDNSITLMDYKDIPHRFYTGNNLTYYFEEDLKKINIKEVSKVKK